MNDLLTWGAIIAAGSSIIAVIKFWMDMGEAVAKAKAAEHTASIAMAKVELAARELSDYKVEAARQFASYGALTLAENRFSLAVEGMRADFSRITERLDRLFERMDK